MCDFPSHTNSTEGAFLSRSSSIFPISNMSLSCGSPVTELMFTCVRCEVLGLIPITAPTHLVLRLTYILLELRLNAPAITLTLTDQWDRKARDCF